jgi:ATP-dependent DNA helicase RecQ
MSAMETSTSSLALSSILRDRFGFDSFRDGQFEAISHLLHYGRLLCIQPTGHGKSLLYQLPTLILPGVTLVISPLLALMRDQLMHLNMRFHIPAATINSDQTEEENAEAIKAAKESLIRILFVSPEQLDDSDRFQFISHLPISLLVIDEAHCISTWGHDFRPSYRQILKLIKVLEKNVPDIKILGLTATADGKTEKDIRQQLCSPEQIIQVHRSSMDRPNITLTVIPASGIAQKLNLIVELLSQLTGYGLIYCATRENTELVADFLRSQNVNAVAYHAGLSPESKRQIQDNFLKNTYSVVAATNALGMGIDKADLRFIIHYDMPGSITTYYQEVGRCGRDGLPADGILLFDPEDRKIQQHFIESAQPSASDFDNILNAIKNAEKALSLNEIKRLTGFHPTRVTVVIAELLEQNYLLKSKESKKQVYQATTKNEPPDLSRYLNQYQVRTNELNAILNYSEAKLSCLMQNLRQHLGDLTAQACRQCSACVGIKYQFKNDLSLIASISQWFSSKVVTIESSKINLISAGIAILNGSLRSSNFVEFMRGRAQTSSEKLGINLELFDSIKNQLKLLNKRHPLSCLISIPTRTWVSRDSIISALADKLGIPAYLDVLIWREHPQARQGELLNNDQRRFNVDQKMTLSSKKAIPNGAIILIDDYIGSGATMKEAARALRKEGNFKNIIIPFTIAAVRWRLGKRGMI